MKAHTVDHDLRQLLREQPPSEREHLTNELAEVLDYQHQQELLETDPVAYEPLGTPTSMPDARVADPMVMLVGRVR